MPDLDPQRTGRENFTLNIHTFLPWFQNKMLSVKAPWTAMEDFQLVFLQIEKEIIQIRPYLANLEWFRSLLDCLKGIL